MVDIKTLLSDLRKLVGELAEDLLARSTSDTKIDAGLREAFHQIEHGGRTAQAFEVWRDDYLDQVAVAWVLACVFVRFMEDNGLIDECWLTGEGERRRLAEDTHELFFRKHPHDTDREYFQHVFKEVGQIPAAKDLFAEGKTPLWAVAPSGDAAMKLLKFWREMDAETGHLKRSFQVESGDTRFLGDLYQELSEKAQKKYALLQTPVFVEEFILDRTLTPALAEFGLEKVRMIDPTCGSGHFLLGGFARLFDLWSQRESNEIKAAQKALDGVWGVDINPFAVAIARFRLIVAAVQACEIKRLKQAPGWNIHLASGDSLLFGSKPGWKGERVTLDNQGSLFEVPAIYAVEDRKTLQEILGQGYHVVVGNPPYIIVRDRALNVAYRELYSTCHRKYSLGVPFTQRFWELAVQKEEYDIGNSGFIGMITANSFMKREFGTKLVEQFFPKSDLTHVIDTSGAYIPGHGTPTVILFGRACKPVGSTVRAVLGIKGEPSTPDDPAQGLVWQSIVRHIDIANAQDEFTNTADMLRETFAKHPWSIGGGGAADLKERLDDVPETLATSIETIGFGAILGEDELFSFPCETAHRIKVSANLVRPLIQGDHLRDWNLEWSSLTYFPYDTNIQLIDDLSLKNYLWPHRTILENRPDFSKQTYRQAGRPFWEYHQIPTDRYRTLLSIAFAFVASHNHFVLDRGGKVFNRSAPIIKLPPEASEDDHLSLLGLLNSSTACFWMKQVSQQKQMTGGDGVRVSTRAAVPYEFAGTQLQKLPLPEPFTSGGLRKKLLAVTKRMDELATNLATLTAAFAIQKGLSVGTDQVVTTYDQFLKVRAGIRAEMVYLQEEMDFVSYAMYGLTDESLLSVEWKWPSVLLDAGQRPFEILQQRNIDEFAVPSAVPSDWPDELQELWLRRIVAIQKSRELQIIEDDHYKRRWRGRQGLFNHTENQDELKTASRSWLLDRLETPMNRKSTKDRPELTTTAQIADVASADAEFLQVASLYRGRPDFDVAALVAELVEAEAISLLTNLRYKAAGLRKREIWERTWDLQRKVDDYERQRKEADELIAKAEKRLSEVLSPLREELDKLEEPLNELREKYSRKWLSQVKKLSYEQPETTARRLAAELPEQALSQLDALEKLAASFNNKHSDFEKKQQKLFATDEEYQKAIKWRKSIPDDPVIDVPPKYTSADFLKTDYWRLRGKLDVPKERWVSYPHCSTDSDPTLVVGWAGWNHLEQATALIAYYDARKREGWDAKHLTPLLAGLDQLLPWIHQWHPEIDAEFGETAGQSFQAMLEHDAHELGLTLEDIRNWTPPEKIKKTPKGRKKKSDAETDE